MGICTKLIFLVIFVFGTIFLLVKPEPIEDKHALLDFMKSVNLTHPLNWDESSSVCSNWTGVTCNHDKSRVIALQLRGFSFRVPITPNTLGRLSALRILSLTSNGISGHFPSDFSKLKSLTALYLQSNNFSGRLPVDFSVWKNISIINFSSNHFSGSIPSSLANLTHLTSLNLAKNSISGEVPEFNLPGLQVLDLSNNNLTGNIPKSLQRFPRWTFLGNNLENLPPALSPLITPAVQPSKRPRKFHKSEKLGIIIGGCTLGFMAVAVLLIVFYSKKDGRNEESANSLKKEGFVKKVASRRENGNGQLVFFEGCNLAFDLEDLLRASAEVLGKGTFGTTYKAALEDVTTVVVKRLKEVSVAKRDFEQQMGVVGSIRHENIAPLRAYYYSKDEKLMVYDYYRQGSVSALLHAKRGENRTPLNWETRIRIAIGAARGITHIHAQNGGKLVHGNIKASNIFQNSEGYGSISDLGLATLVSPVTPPSIRTGGYRAPEVTDTRKASQLSDVYSFGVLLLELLTGKSPIYATGGEFEVVHLVRWVHSVVREEWTAEVFDVELMKYPNIEEEMVEMLQIGLACAARMPEQRPRMTDVLRRVEDVRRLGIENPPSSGSRSEGSTPGWTPKVTDIGSSSNHIEIHQQLGERISGGQ